MRRSTHEPTLSVRLLWPFVRVMSNRAPNGALGVGAELVDPEARLPHSAVLRLLGDAVRLTNDPALGLHAAARTEPGDIDVLEYAARGCSDLGEAYLCTVRYFDLLNSAAKLSLERQGDRALLRYEVADGLEEPPQCADFVLAGMILFARRNASVDEAELELRLMHDEPEYADEYARFSPARVRFGARHDALVMPRAWLEAPLREEESTLSRAFQLRADQMLAHLRERESITGRARELAIRHLASGTVTMSWMAKRLGSSPATLRRRLKDEGATFTGILDDARRRIAERELRDGTLSIGEIAFAVGFANAGAFDRAFKRWTGEAPSKYRARHRRS